MRNFKDLNIKAETSSFKGEKVSIKRVFNVEIKVLAFKIEPSKKKENTQLLTLQIERDGEPRIIFTGSNVLIKQIQQVSPNDFPFVTTIKNDNEYYEFT